MQAVQTKQFEGPLDLLLGLIEKEKLDISKISLAKITNDYLEEIQKMKNFEVGMVGTPGVKNSQTPGVRSAENLTITNENLAEFLIVASKLLYLKSRAVLPTLSTEEEEEIGDLESQLKEYKKFKEASSQFAEILDKNQRSFEPGVRNADFNLFLPPLNVDLNYLMNVLQEALSRMPKKEKLEEKKVETKVTLEEKLNHLSTLIQKGKKISFHTIIKTAKTKGEVIVTFLALLEMIKRKAVKVTQTKNFGDLMVRGI